jgi:methylenetetrahydrofolate dehydrogenase (NADP+)/methenyltetrahydrofolate cyclohydrolase
VYVRHKVKTGTEAGFRVDLERLPDTAALEDLLSIVERLNRSDAHDGILVQSPLPKAMGPGAQQRVFDTIAAQKDVDGFGAKSVGLLVQNRPTLVACTPAGIIELLEREGIEIARRHAVVIGRSDIVGKPMALLLLHRDATVTICHSRTPDLAAVCRWADILVAAVGKPGLVTRDFVKPGAVVIDVAVNRVTDAAVAASLYPAGHKRLATFDSKGSILVGDVHPEVAEVAGALTPVPGGVGPLTITMLMQNTLRAARGRVEQQ